MLFSGCSGVPPLQWICEAVGQASAAPQPAARQPDHAKKARALLPARQQEQAAISTRQAYRLAELPRLPYIVNLGVTTELPTDHKALPIFTTCLSRDVPSASVFHQGPVGHPLPLPLIIGTSQFTQYIHV